jgi:hypothetical protein
MERCDTPRSNASANRAISSNSSVRALTLPRIVRYPSRSSHWCETSIHLDANIARRSTSADRHNSNRPIDILECRSLVSTSTTAADANSTRANESTPVRKRPETKSNFVRPAILVDLDDLLVRIGIHPLYALPVQESTSTVVDDGVVYIIRPRETFACSSARVPRSRPLPLEIALLREPHGNTSVKSSRGTAKVGVRRECLEKILRPAALDAAEHALRLTPSGTFAACNADLGSKVVLLDRSGQDLGKFGCLVTVPSC